MRGGRLTTQRKAEASGGGGALTDANNGLSLNGTIVQLGQSIGAVGNPAVLLNNREIPLGGFQFSMISAGPLTNLFVSDVAWQMGENLTGGLINAVAPIAFEVSDLVGDWLQIGGQAQNCKMGDIDLTNNGMFIEVDDNANRTIVTSGGDIFFQIDVLNEVYFIGDLNGVQAGIYGYFDQLGASAFICSGAGAAHIGDCDNIGNLTLLRVDDPNQVIRLQSAGKSGFTDETGASFWLAGSLASGQFDFGDLDAVSNETKLQINDTNQTLVVSSAANNYLSIDVVNALYKIGDIGLFNNGSILTIDDVNGSLDFSAAFLTLGGGGTSIEGTGSRVTVNLTGSSYLDIDVPGELFRFGDISGAGNGTMIELIDNLQIALIHGRIATTGTTTMITTTGGAWGNGAGASAGTLTNAPAVGNPTKWIPVDDNGTTRHIPAW